MLFDFLKARSERKAVKSAAESQQAGIREAGQFVRGAAQQAQQLTAPIAQLYQPSVAELIAQQRQFGAAGQRGIEGLTSMQQQPLDVSRFADPSMQFQMQQGREAIEQSAAARGGLLSGATLKSLTEFGQGLASQNYQQAVDTAMREREQQAGISRSLSDIGRVGTGITQQLFNVGAGGLGTLAQQQEGLGSELAGLAMGSGNVSARATAAAPNALMAALTAGQQAAGNLLPGIFSDEEVKERIKSVTDDEIEEFLESLEPKSFEYDDDVIEQGAPQGRKVGVMAQDVMKSRIGKQLVEEDESNVKKLDIPMSVSALLASTASLNRRINKLEGKR